MAYEIQVTATNFLVSTSSTEYSVTVQSPATPNFTITNEVSSIAISSQQTTTTIYTEAVELVLADLNTFWKGEWTTGTYYRGDIVVHQYSQYFLDDFSVDILAPYTSTVVPPNDPTWIRFNWHEAPFAVLTVTNSASIGNDLAVTDDVTIGGDLSVAGDVSIGGGAGGNGLTINSTATFNGRVIVNNSSTLNGRLVVNGTATFNNDVEFIGSDITVEDLILNGDKWTELYQPGNPSAGSAKFALIKTTATNKNIRIGLSTANQIENTFFGNSPAYTDYLSSGSIAHYVTNAINTNSLYSNNLKIERSYAALQVRPHYYGISPTYFRVNALNINTNTARLAAFTLADSETQQYNDYGYVNKWFGSGSQEIAASNTWTTTAGTLTNYIHLTRDNVEIASYSSDEGGLNPYSNRRASKVYLNDTQITLNAYGLQNSGPYYQDPATVAKLTVQQTNNNSGNIKGEAYYHTFINNGYPSGQGNNGGFYFASTATSPAITAFRLGVNAHPTGYINSADSIFEAVWAPYEPLNSYIIIKPDRVFFQSTQYVELNTPVVEFNNSTEVRFGAGNPSPISGRGGSIAVGRIFGTGTNAVSFPNGISVGTAGLAFTSTSTVQTVPFEGYDQGLL